MDMSIGVEVESSTVFKYEFVIYVQVKTGDDSAGFGIDRFGC